MKKYPFKILDSYGSEDTKMFFGRDEEIAIIHEMLFRSSILFIYGPSGTGKTSLIQCGLATKFQSHDWLPLNIRRGNNINDTLEDVLKKTEAALGIAEDSDENDTDWWTITKEPGAHAKKLEPNSLARRFRSIYHNSFRPVYLIFDQFEELFIFGTKDEQEKFLNAIKDILKIEQPVKMIFSMREEYLWQLYDAEKSIPQFLNNRFRLEAMDYAKIEKIIRGIHNYEYSNVKFSAGDITNISQAIFEAVRDKEFVQPPYLQVYLDTLYLKITNDETREADATITLQDVKEVGSIGDILRDFLSDRVKNICRTYGNISEEKVWTILSCFVTFEGTKEPIDKEELYNRMSYLNLEVVDNIIKALIDARILRQTPQGDRYELAHDSLGGYIAAKRSTYQTTLLELRRLISSQLNIHKTTGDLFSEKQMAFIEPFLPDLKEQKLITEEGIQLLNSSRLRIVTEKQIQRNKEVELAKKKTRRNALIWLSGIIIGIAFLSYQQINKNYNRNYIRSEENRYWLIANILKRSGNPTLSYLALQEGLKKNPGSDTLTKQLSELEASNLVYLQGVYPVMSEVTGVRLSDSTLTISGNSTVIAWNTMNRLVTQVINYEDTLESKKIETTNGLLTVSLNSGFIEIKGIKGSSLVKIPKKDIYDLEDVIVSKNGRFVLTNNSLLYDLQSSKLKNLTPSMVVPVPKYSTDKYTEVQKIYAPTASVFLKDDQFAIGYESGDVIVYAYNSNKKDHLDTLELYTSSNDSYAENNQVIKMAADKKYRFLFASNSQSEIGVCDLGQLRNRQSETEGTPRKKNSLDSSDIKDLEDGHTGPVDCLAFSENDSLLLSGSSDNTAILWDISTKNIERISVLKGPNSSEITAAGFFNNDNDIITVSSKAGSTAISRVYLWKRGRPSAIPRSQLYNFSPFDFSIWGLAIDTILPKTTTSLYRYALDYYLNLPATSEFPNEQSYNQKLTNSLLDVRRSYSTLKNKSDYRKVISSYADSLLYLCRYAYLPHIEQDILDAGSQIDQWKEFFTDTVNKKLPFALTSKISMPFNLLTEGQNPNYDEGLRLLNFYTDSVWKPFVREYPNSTTLKSLKKSIDICWAKYYLYTGHADSALTIATELSKNEIRGVNYNIYLMASYIALGKPDQADTVYVNTQSILKGYIKTINDNRLRALLKRLKEKNIAEEDIDKFISDVKLEEKDD